MLGIAHRSILVKYAQKSKNELPPKPLAESAKTIGDWIKASRQQKNLTPGHVAAKMGIASGMIDSWEYEKAAPEEHHLASLERIFGKTPISKSPYRPGK